jgi:hypothetical protein
VCRRLGHYPINLHLFLVWFPVSFLWILRQWNNWNFQAVTSQIKFAFIIESLEAITSWPQPTFYTMQSLLNFLALREKTKRDFKS